MFRKKEPKALEHGSHGDPALRAHGCKPDAPQSRVPGWWPLCGLRSAQGAAASACGSSTQKPAGGGGFAARVSTGLNGIFPLSGNILTMTVGPLHSQGHHQAPSSWVLGGEMLSGRRLGQHAWKTVAGASASSEPPKPRHWEHKRPSGRVASNSVFRKKFVFC